MREVSWMDLVSWLKDGADPVEGTHEEVLKTIKNLYTSAEKAEEVYSNDPSAFCEKIEREIDGV